jgi:fructuronate reductase/mannitol 2-dehydrogenase
VTTRPLPLNTRTLRRHAAHVDVPEYDRTRLEPGVVHLSVGAFHRSHQAVYFDELARRGADDWAVTGVGLRRAELKAALQAQDGLYTVVTRGCDGDSGRVIGVMTRYLFAPHERSAVLAALADERTRLVTLTITSNGYNIDAETGTFAAGATDVLHDLVHPDRPRSALGLLVEALRVRRQAGRRPFTVLSCDNMPGNGATARAAVVGMAALNDPALADWIDAHGSFPGSMVDRITPRTTDADLAMVARNFGVRDLAPVVAEPFMQWVVEDDFCNGRPPLEDVGVQFVRDVQPYALTKNRLLNASHSALGYIGTLAGYSRLDEVMADEVFARYVERMMEDEVSPLLPSLDIDLAQYTAALRQRLANPVIADGLPRLCRNGSTKVQNHLLSSIREARAVGRPRGLLTLAVAAWCRYLRGDDERGRAVEIEDPNAARLSALARLGGDDPRPLLRDQSTFGSLGRCSDFVDDIERDLRELAVHGVRAVAARRVGADIYGAVR